MNQAKQSKKYVVRRMTEHESRNWGVYDSTGNLIEGGFFDKAAAQYSADDLNRNT